MILSSAIAAALVGGFAGWVLADQYNQPIWACILFGFVILRIGIWLTRDIEY